MWPHDGQDSRSRSSPSIEPNRSAAPQLEQKLSVSAIQAGTPPPDGEVGRAAVAARARSRPRRVVARRAARRSPRPTSAREPDEADDDPGQAEQPLPRSTGIHAQAERQMRTIASAVVTTSSGAAMRTHSLISGSPSRAPRLSAVIAIAPQMSTDDREVDVVLLERRRGDLGHGPGRQALEAGRQRRRLADGLPVEHRHAGLPAFVVHRHAPSVATSRPGRPAVRRSGPGGRPDLADGGSSGRRDRPRPGRRSIATPWSGTSGPTADRGWMCCAAAGWVRRSARLGHPCRCAARAASMRRPTATRQPVADSTAREDSTVGGDTTAGGVTTAGADSTARGWSPVEAASTGGATANTCVESPVAIRVISTSSPRASLKLAPKMTFASGSARSRIASAACADLAQAEVGRTGHVEEDAAGALDARPRAAGSRSPVAPHRSPGSRPCRDPGR